MGAFQASGVGLGKQNEIQEQEGAFQWCFMASCAVEDG